MDTNEKKLTSDEIEEMLKEVESIERPRRTVNENRKKKKRIHIDRIIAAVVVVALVVCAAYFLPKLVKKAGNSIASETTANPLMDEKYPEISDVVYNYLNAYLIKDPQKRLATLAQYVGNMGDINENDINQKGYVKSYTEVECYTKEGPYKDTYVVYAYYQMELPNIATTVPCISRMYVIRDADTGNVYIQNKVSEQIKDYMNQVSKDKDVQELFAEVNKEFEDAKKSDAGLKKYYDDVEKKKAEAQSEEESTEAAQTTVAHTEAVSK